MKRLNRRGGDERLMHDGPEPLRLSVWNMRSILKPARAEDLSAPLYEVYPDGTYKPMRVTGHETRHFRDGTPYRGAIFEAYDG